MLLDRLLRWMGLGSLYACLLVPLVVVPHWLFPFISGKALLFQVSVNIALVCLGLLTIRGAEHPRIGMIGWCLLSFIFVMFWADLFAPVPRLAFLSTVERRDGLINLLWMAGFFVSLSLVKDWDRFFSVAVLTGVPMCLVAMIQIPFWPTSEVFPRVHSLIGNASYLGNYAALCLFLCWWLYSRGLKRTATIGAIAAFISLGLSQTRGAVLALLAGFIVALWLMGRFRRIAEAITVAGMVAVIFAYALPDNVDFLARLRPTLSNERWEIWETAWRAFQARPLLGWGHEGFAWGWKIFADPNSWQASLPYDRVHNFVLDRLIEGGILGLGAYLALLAATAWKVRNDPILAGLLACYLTSNLFIFDVIVTQLFFVAILALEDRDVARDARAVADDKALWRVGQASPAGATRRGGGK